VSLKVSLGRVAENGNFVEDGEMIRLFSHTEITGFTFRGLFDLIDVYRK
jgi:hypothetical protein